MSSSTVPRGPLGLFPDEPAPLPPADPGSDLLSEQPVEQHDPRPHQQP
ncbi:MAG: hypothetical protein KY476_12705 [Planctomycetes bacterium]|nr:hypothetical protein [Planctomycetota bacterium]